MGWFLLEDGQMEMVYSVFGYIWDVVKNTD
jgi:hypothetical protein